MKALTLNNSTYTRFLLQVGLAVVFAYPAIASFRQPANWTAYLPNFLASHIAPVTLLKIFALYELVLAIWLLSGQYLKLAGLLAAATLASIVIVNPQQLIITFRDIGLACMALALVFFPAKTSK